MITLGDLWDSIFTLELKDTHCKNPANLASIIININTTLGEIKELEEKWSKDPKRYVGCMKFKIYKSEVRPEKEHNYDDAKYQLQKIVKELWNVQEFINLDEWKEASREELRDYIENLHRLNMRRNFYIDMVNQLYLEKAIENNS